MRRQWEYMGWIGSRRADLLAVAVSVLLPFAIGLAACAHAPDPWAVSGAAIAQAQATYEATATAMDDAVRRGAVSVEDYRAFRAFGRRWEALYPLAGETWKAADAIGDPDGARDAAAIVARLVAELRPFSQALGGAIAAFDADGGN